MLVNFIYCRIVVC